MDCASCVAHVEKAARRVAGTVDCRVNLAAGRAIISFDPAATAADKIAAAITAAGYPTSARDGSKPVDEQGRLERQRHHARAWLRRAVIAISLWLPVEVIHWLHGYLVGHTHGVSWVDWLSFATSTVAMLFVAAAFYRSAFAALKLGTSNMDTLIAMGVTVAYGYSAAALAGFIAGAWHELPLLYFNEATALLGLISLGHWLESRAREKAGSAIRELLSLAPDRATRLARTRLGILTTTTVGWGSSPPSAPLHVHGGDEPHPTPNGTPSSAGSVSLNAPDSSFEDVPVSDLAKGDLILIRPGDRVPIDGVITDGRSTVDESMLTGESLPRTKLKGDEVTGGTINRDGALKVRVTRTGSATALAQIITLVEHAQSSKPAVQKLADRVAAVFVPVVLAIAVATAIGWYAYGRHAGHAPAKVWADIARAMCSVLIVACPCALGLAVPAALMVGTGRGAKRGILFRDIDALQSAEQIRTVVFDKTGTITAGTHAVTAVECAEGADERTLLHLAASAESFSRHPLATAIVAHVKELGVELSEPSSFKEIPGLGVEATVDGRTIRVGGKAFGGMGVSPMHNRLSEGTPPDAPTSPFAHGRDAHATAESTLVDSAESSIHVYVAEEKDNQLFPLGTLFLADQLRSDSAATISHLKSRGLRTVLLTGDRDAVAREVAKAVGIDDVRADVRPEGKAAVIVELQKGGTRVAMVGDGINDAPALAQADLGIAVGSGSDVAKVTAAIVLLGSSIAAVPEAIRLSRATMRTVRLNLFFALIYNVLAIPLAAFGILTPIVSAAAMALSDVTVIGNALLLNRKRID